jgi:hypothetical protein
MREKLNPAKIANAYELTKKLKHDLAKHRLMPLLINVKWNDVDDLIQREQYIKNLLSGTDKNVSAKEVWGEFKLAFEREGVKDSLIDEIDEIINELDELTKFAIIERGDFIKKRLDRTIELLDTLEEEIVNQMKQYICDIREIVRSAYESVRMKEASRIKNSGLTLRYNVSNPAQLPPLLAEKPTLTSAFQELIGMAVDSAVESDSGKKQVEVVEIVKETISFVTVRKVEVRIKSTGYIGDAKLQSINQIIQSHNAVLTTRGDSIENDKTWNSVFTVGFTWFPSMEYERRR